MSSDFNFTVTSCFLGNVGVKLYFNTQCPPPPKKNQPHPGFSDLPTALHLLQLSRNNFTKFFEIILKN